MELIYEMLVNACFSSLSPKVAFHSLSQLHGFHGKEVLVKDVTAWADMQAAILRAHAVYLIRLWRKTPGRSKCHVSICVCISLRMVVSYKSAKLVV